MKKLNGSLLRILIIMLMFSGMRIMNQAHVSAQTTISLILDSFDPNQYPQMRAYLSVFDDQGYVIPDATQFTVSEDNTPVTALDIQSVFEYPLDIALVIDLSASMGYGGSPTPLQNTVEQAKDLINNLAPNDRVAVIGFSNKAAVYQQLDSDKRRATQALDSLITGQNSTLNDAVIQAVQELDGASAKRPIIILLTDGPDSGLSRSEFSEAIYAAVSRSVVVYPIGWAGAKSTELQMLANLTHGKMSFLSGSYPDSQAFQTAFADIRNDLSSKRLQYQITYQSGMIKDAAQHNVIFGLDYLGKQAQVSASFVSPQPDAVVFSLPGFQDGMSVGGLLKIAPVYTTTVPIKQMVVWLNNTELEKDTNAPFEYSWDTTASVSGVYTLTVILTDERETSATQKVKLNVRPPIIVTITGPNQGNSVSGATLVSADVDSLAKVARVELWVDKGIVDTLDRAPYQFEWNTRKSTSEIHDLRVVAIDINNFSSEATVRVRVVNEVKKPDIVPIIMAVALASLLIIVPIGMRLRRKARHIAPVPVAPAMGSMAASAAFSQATLVEIDGVNPGQGWALSPVQEVRLGRKRDENDIPLKGANASRQHAVVRFDGNQYVITNLKSNNPILVNSAPVQQHAMQNNDMIQIGESVFQFQG